MNYDDDNNDDDDYFLVLNPQTLMPNQYLFCMTWHSMADCSRIHRKPMQYISLHLFICFLKKMEKTKHFVDNNREKGLGAHHSFHTFLVQSEEMWVLPCLCDNYISLLTNISLNAPKSAFSFKTVNISKRLAE